MNNGSGLPTPKGFSTSSSRANGKPIAEKCNCASTSSSGDKSSAVRICRATLSKASAKCSKFADWIDKPPAYS